MSMEDEHICIDDLLEHLGATANLTYPGAFYGVCKLVASFIHIIELLLLLCWFASGDHKYHTMDCEPNIVVLLQVFDGHGGTDAALFIKENILRFIVDDVNYPFCVEKAIKSAFFNADHAFADEGSLDSSSGTTALTALIFGR